MEDMSIAAIPGIVVGIDGSADGEAALRWAVADAKLNHQKITLVHVVSPLVGGYSGIGMSTPVWPQDLNDWRQDRGRQLLDNAVHLAHSLAGEELEIDTMMPFGAIVPALVELTARTDMMVLGSRGLGTFNRALLGSVSTALAHHAHCPVVLVHANAPAVPANAPILLGTDGSAGSLPAVELAFREAARRNAELIVLHACSDAEVPQLTAVPWWALDSDAERQLTQFLAPYRERYPEVPVSYHVLRDHPARHLVEESESAQLVVVGSRGRGGLAGMLLGSVSSTLVHATTTPVIVARHDPARVESSPTVATAAQS
jgi:nucleotide-binding universal stress UspA family protein